jgi:hypothetical protein
MWIDDLVVEPDREDHLAWHGISIDEVYEVAFGVYIVDRSREGRYRLIGQTESGR